MILKEMRRVREWWIPMRLNKKLVCGTWRLPFDTNPGRCQDRCGHVRSCVLEPFCARLSVSTTLPQVRGIKKYGRNQSWIARRIWVLTSAPVECSVVRRSPRASTLSASPRMRAF